MYLSTLFKALRKAMLNFKPLQAKTLYHKVFNPLFTQRLFMRVQLISCIVAIFLLQASAKSFSQITLSEKNAPIGKIFKQIKKQTNLTFLYDSKDLNNQTKVSVNVKNASIDETLKQCFKLLPLIYQISEQTVLIKRVETNVSNLKKEVITISGVVKDENGQPLIGLNVSLKNGNTSTQTNVTGEYKINADGNQTLVFSYIGYKTKEVQINNLTAINVVMQQDNSKLEEVVVIGYGTQTRKDITGSVSTISGKQIKDIPQAGIDQRLQGLSAGVQVTQTSGQPSGSVSVRIRGTSSITAGNEPLYVIDGIPFYNANTTLLQGPAGIAGTGTVSNGLSVISPNDIESITILKDAASTSIYGSRAANGVVIITTKRGKAGKAVIEFDAYTGTQQLNKQLDVLNASQMAQLTNEARLNGISDRGNSTNLPDNLLPVPAFANPAALGLGTNWQDQIFKNAPIQNYQLSISGGNQDNRYAVSGGYFNQDGIVKNSGYKRYNGRFNLDQKVNERLKIGSSISINNATNLINRAFGFPTQGGVITGALLQTPSLNVYDVNGDYARFDNSRTGRFPGLMGADNPLSNALEYLHNINTTRFQGDVFGNIKLTENLSFRTSVGADINYLKNNIFIPIRNSSVDVDGLGNPVTIASIPPNTGNGFAFASQELTWINENLLTYSKTFNQVHRLTAVAGFNIQASDIARQIARTINFPNNLITTANGGQTDLTNSFSEQWRMVSFLSRVNYTYKDKYLLTAAIRTDGSSRFGPNERFGYFPSVSAGWIVSEENFMKKVDFVSNLKLRASYGATGNAEIINTVNSFANYAYLGSLSQANYAFGPGAQTIANGLAPGSLSNGNLGWETTKQTDLGFDLSFFNGRIEFVADYYKKVTNNILLRNYPLPATTGFTSAFINVGKMQNSGYEFALNTVNVNKALIWKTSFNIAFNQNKVIDLGKDVPNIFAGNSITRPGDAIGLFFGLQTDGIFQNQDQINAVAVQNGNRNNTKPGDIRFKDNNGDGFINDNDRKIIGNPMPKSTYGITNNFTYAGFDLSIFISGVSGNQIFNQTRRNNETMDGTSNLSARSINRWVSVQQPGDGITPRATTLDPNGNNRYSDRWIEDGSFMRIKNLTLGYRIPTKTLKRLGIQSIRLYGSAQNLATITKYSGYDPEANATSGGWTNPLDNGVDNGNYPVPKTFIFGLNLQLH